MELIVISDSGYVANEAKIISQLFEAGMERFHLRKPGWDYKQLIALLSQIGQNYHRHIAIHEHHEIAGQFNLKRLHYPERERFGVSLTKLMDQKEQGYELSTSVHDLDFLQSLGVFDYVFFGPVFNSISKPGYKGRLTDGFRLKKSAGNPEVIALGGIGQYNLGKIKEMNFDGAAVVGAIWNTPEQAVASFKKLKESANNE